jgi:hypothetical protein
MSHNNFSLFSRFGSGGWAWATLCVTLGKSGGTGGDTLVALLTLGGRVGLYYKWQQGQHPGAGDGGGQLALLGGADAA